MPLKTTRIDEIWAISCGEKNERETDDSILENGSLLSWTSYEH